MTHPVYPPASGLQRLRESALRPLRCRFDGTVATSSYQATDYAPIVAERTPRSGWLRSGPLSCPGHPSAAAVPVSRASTRKRRSAVVDARRSSASLVRRRTSMAMPAAKPASSGRSGGSTRPSWTPGSAVSVCGDPLLGGSIQTVTLISCSPRRRLRPNAPRAVTRSSRRARLPRLGSSRRACP